LVTACQRLEILQPRVRDDVSVALALLQPGLDGCIRCFQFYEADIDTCTAQGFKKTISVLSAPKCAIEYYALASLTV
jgi:hypothetical protein